MFRPSCRTGGLNISWRWTHQPLEWPSPFTPLKESMRLPCATHRGPVWHRTSACCTVCIRLWLLTFESVLILTVKMKRHWYQFLWRKHWGNMQSSAKFCFTYSLNATVNHLHSFCSVSFAWNKIINFLFCLLCNCSTFSRDVSYLCVHRNFEVSGH